MRCLPPDVSSVISLGSPDSDFIDEVLLKKKCMKLAVLSTRMQGELVVRKLERQKSKVEFLIGTTVGAIRGG